MAKKLNTVAKGNAFEDIVFSRTKELLESEMLGLSPRHSRIFQKKAYTGKTGNKIIFDISIETYHPDSDEYSILTLIECKDYESPIQVEKLRNFASSIEDVGGHKGYFITTSNFQRGAIIHARTYKIGLVKFNIQNLGIEEWVLRRVGSLSYEKKLAIQEELYSINKMSQYNFVAVCGYDCYSNFYDFVSEQLIGKSSMLNVDFISDDVIKSKASDLFIRMQHQQDTFISTDFLLDIVSKELNVQLVQNQVLYLGHLGICHFSQRRIYISPELEYDSPRWRFTLAHEIGHYILHEGLCIMNKVNAITDDETNLIQSINEKSLLRLEIQANKFASNILIPENLFKAFYAIKHQELGIRKFPYLRLDDQKCNVQDCLIVFSYLGSKFNISMEMVKIKLKELGYLTICDTHKRLGSFI